MGRRKKYHVNYGKLVVSLLVLVAIIAISAFGINQFILNRNGNEFGDLEEQVEEIIPEDITINLVAIGDVMCHSPNYNAAYDSTTKTYDFSPMFTNVAKYITKADIAIRKS